VTVAPSATTQASNNFVAEHLAEATTLGQRLAELVGAPDEFVEAIAEGFDRLADPVYVEGQHLVAPGLGSVVGVRLPLMEAVHRAFKRGTRKTSTSFLLDIAGRLLAADTVELRWFAIWDLGRSLPTDPERTWQLLRRAAATATEWITIDTLAHPYGEGILLEPRRWAELQSLIYSPSRWERRLVGSTLATLPFAKGMPGGRDKATCARALALVGDLIGDNEPDVQKALSWALRNYTSIDAPAVVEFLEREAEITKRTDDGHRAWVIRDSLLKLPPDTSGAIRDKIEGIRRRPGAPSTSRAAVAVAQLNMPAAANLQPAAELREE
jgi:3-methyladenine DNA glycosylase AlkD